MLCFLKSFTFLSCATLVQNVLNSYHDCEETVRHKNAFKKQKRYVVLQLEFIDQLQDEIEQTVDVSFRKPFYKFYLA